MLNGNKEEYCDILSRKMETAQRNSSIDAVRLIMALLIVALHTYPFKEYSLMLSYFLSQVLARLGVPFFATISGYFFFEKHITNRKVITAVKKNLSLYVIWSAIYISTHPISHGGSISESILYVFKTFFLTGFYHLWYVLAIIYTIILVWLFNNTKYGLACLSKISIVLLLMGIIMFGYGNFFFKIPFFQTAIGKLNMNNNMETQWATIVIPFFLLGDKLHRANCTSWFWEKAEKLLVLATGCYLFEVVLLEVADLKQSTTLCLFTYPCVALLTLCLIKHPNILSQNCSKYAAGTASFIYFAHIMIVLFLQKHGFYETPTYFITITVTSILGFFIVWSDNCYLKKLIT